jgi:hypothetical protein
LAVNQDVGELIMEAVVISVLSMVIGVLLGHWSAIRREEHRVVIEKRIQYVTEFVAQATHNLRYILEPEILGGKKPQPFGDFAVMGRRAAFFVSDEAAEAIDELTSEYPKARNKSMRQDPVQTSEDSFTDFKGKLDELTALLRTEVRVTKKTSVVSKLFSPLRRRRLSA